MPDARPEPRTVLVANPSADVYGSDLQLLESISAMTTQGWTVIVALPALGPLVDRLRARGADVRIVPCPVLRRASVSARGVGALGAATPAAIRTLRRVLRHFRPDVVYVNTVTIPWWMTAARSLLIPVICHVHEAEDASSRLVLTALAAPLSLANVIISNSTSSTEAICAVIPRLRGRIRLIYNGVPGPPFEPMDPARADGVFRLATVCRLSPRKAPDVTLEAVARLRRGGRDVRLEVCGTAFAGYEWYERDLRDRSEQPDLAGAVTWSGYVSPIWPALQRVDAVVAPSLREPFGNAVIEAQLSRRPVVASAAMGHLETVQDGATGLLVAPGSPAAMASAVGRLMDDPKLALRLARQGQQQALDRFSVERYAADIASLVATT